MEHRNHRLWAQDVHTLVSYPLNRRQYLGLVLRWRFTAMMKMKAPSTKHDWNWGMSRISFSSEILLKCFKYSDSTCESFQTGEAQAREMPHSWLSTVLQHCSHLMHLRTLVASLQPPRLRDDHLLQSFSELIVSGLFMDSAYNQSIWEILLHERHK